LASSFQRRQPRSVSITLAPTNPPRTFASTKFRRAFPAKPCTSGANGHHHGVSLVELYAVMGSVMRIRRRLRHLPQLWRVTPATPLQLRRALPSPSFLTSRRWAHHRVRLVNLILFCRSRAHLEVVPIESISPHLSLFCCSHHDRAAVHRPCRLRFRPSPPLPAAGEDLHEFPFIFSLSFAPRPSPSPPPPSATRTPGAPRASPVPTRMEVEKIRSFFD
jgi:hypothetical protein